MSRALVSILVVALACLNMVQASISPMSISANMNSFAPNVFVAAFYQRGQAANPLSMQALLPIPFHKVENLNCVFEVLGEKRPTDITRTYPINVTVEPSHNPSVAAFNGAVNIAETKDIGNFELVCSFFLAADLNIVNGQSIVYAWNVYDSSTLLGASMVRPFASFADYITTSLAYPDSPLPSTFIISRPNEWADQTTMKITNTSRPNGTSAAITVFSPAGGFSYCDVLWDGINYPNSAAVSISSDATEVNVTFGSVINSSRDLLVSCPHLKAFTFDAGRYRPSLLTFSSGRGQGFSIPTRVMGNFGEAAVTDE